MIPQPYLALMHGEIDGTNTLDESRRLAGYLAGSPEAQDHLADLREAVAMVEQTPPLPPPPDLRQKILAATAALPLPGTAPAPTPARFGTMLANLRTQASLRYAFAAGFAVCLVLGAVVWQLTAAPGQVAPEDLRGSILREIAAGRGTAGPTADIDLDGVSGTVSVYQAGDRTLVQLTLTSDRAIEVRLVGDGPLACREFRAAPPVPGSLSLTERQLVFSHAGAGDYEFVLSPRAPDVPGIKLQIVETGIVRFERILTSERI